MLYRFKVKKSWISQESTKYVAYDKLQLFKFRFSTVEEMDIFGGWDFCFRITSLYMYID